MNAPLELVLSRLITTRHLAIPPALPALLIELHERHGIRDKNKAIRGGDQVDLGAVAHPLIVVFLEKLRRERELIAAWSNRLLCGGEHLAHSHPRGGESHVVYIAAEPNVGGTLCLECGDELIEIESEPGLLVSFPHWIKHWVTRYEGATPRLSIAYDLR